ncbi:MAG: xanthine dehydrogenase family protein molybdopterin-binding subunit, partial [bacterium]
DESGDVEAGAKAAATSLKREYWAPYLAHAPMEPMTAVLRIKDGSADLWAGTQGPVGAVGLVSRFSGISTDNITMHTTYLGGGFGRRGTLTHIVELTEIVVASKKTVKLIWSREDDIRSGLYRPASLMRINASVDSQGHISAWRARRAGGNITPETLKNALPGIFPNFPASIVEKLADLSDYVFSNWSVDEPSVEGLWEDYDLPNREVSHVTIEHGMPNTFWRSVGHSFTAFAKESMIDELAVNAGIDPVELRLKNTANNPRLQNVIRIASEKMNAMTPAADRYLGFAAHGSFLTDVAQIAEVSVNAGRIRVHKVTAVVDCGLAVNPDIVRAQVEGAIMFGLTAALHGEITLQNGAVQQSNFHDYPILRMNEAPDVDVIIVESEGAPTGIGEPGLPPIAPAVANAVYRATGRRLTELPLKLT